jgi:hypothetical protein
LFTAVAHAVPTDAEKETARSLMDDGDRMRQRQDLPNALQRYQAAHEIMKVPTTGIEVAKTYALMGKLVEARRTALEAANLPVVEGEAQVMVDARAEAASLAAQLAARIPSALFRIAPEQVQAKVVVDGVELPAAARGLPYKSNPGEHVVQVSAQGFQTAEQKFTLEEGAEAIIDVNLVAEPSSNIAPAAPALAGTQPVDSSTPPPFDAQSETAGTSGSTNAYVAFGLAGVGVLGGSITGLLSLGKTSDAKEHCAGNDCTAAAQDDIDSAKSLATISNIGFGVAILAGAWGVYEVLSSSAPSGDVPATALESRHAPQLSLGILPGQATAALQGVF